jgi:hypothetical protein
MKAMINRNLWFISMTFLPVLICPCSVISSVQQPVTNKDSSCKYFKIQVVDRQTGRGVPLVQLRTTNNIRYLLRATVMNLRKTDSACTEQD